jgi:hypothetical protein
MEFELISELFYIYNPNNFSPSFFLQTFINNLFLFVKQLLIILLITLRYF